MMWGMQPHRHYDRSSDHPTAVSRRATELRAKAVELRGMAATAMTEDVRDALLRLAGGYEVLAADVAEREGIAPATCR